MQHKQLFPRWLNWQVQDWESSKVICYLFTADLRSIHPYNSTIAPTKPSTPSQGAGVKLSGTRASGASFESATINPALITPHKLSPTINPDATSVPSRSARSGFGAERMRRSYQ